MNKSPGFILIELLVSSVISSMIAMVLFAGFGQTNRALQTIDNLVDISYKQTVAVKQMTKDISGAFIPYQAQKPRPQASSSAKATADKPAGGQASVKQSKEKEKKRLTKVFYGTTKDGRLDTLTCITNNPTLEYPACVVRVVYRLVPEERFNPKKPAYVLMRQESATKLDFDDFKPETKENGVRAYELVANVKNVTVAYTAQINKQSKEQKPGAPGGEKTIEKEYVVLHEWIMEDEQEKQYKEYTKIPYAVDVDLVLWDERRERERKVSFKILAPNQVNEFEEEAKPTQSQQTPLQKPSTSAPQTQPGKPTGVAQKPASALDNTLSALKGMLMADGSAKGGKK